MAPLPPEPLLEVRDLRRWFPLGGRWVGPRRWVKAVDGVDFSVHRGEIFGLVGESGSGKSTLGRSILRLVEPTGGSIRFDGVDLGELDRRTMRSMRRRMQIVFQDPYGSLNPRMQIRQIVAEPLQFHRIVPDEQVTDRVVELLQSVGLESYFMYRYPHEMSGGQRQRIAIARALALNPEFLVADEPVSALDVSVQAQILGILLELQQSRGIALLFITHDLAVVERVADRVAIMHSGRFVEQGPTGQVLSSPQHAYTRRLVAAAL